MNRTRALLLIFCVTPVLGFAAWGKELAKKSKSEPSLREGDILFQSLPRNPLIDAIEGCTQSPFSHCGILHRNGEGRWVVIEAIGPVKHTPLDRWVDQGRKNKYWVRRLKPEHQNAIPAMVKATEKYLGRPYDIRYRLDDEAIYCSELIYKAYRDATGRTLGRIERLGDLEWEPWAGVIEHIEGGPVPRDREMITPKALAEAEDLEAVEKN